MNSGQPSVQQTFEQFTNCEDLLHRTYPLIHIDIFYFGHLVDKQQFERDVITPLMNVKEEEVLTLLQESQFEQLLSQEAVNKAIAYGRAVVFYRNFAYKVDVYGPKTRSVEQSETETVITGPHDAFIESIDTNLSLIRRRVKTSRLKAVRLYVGEITKSTVYILYIDGIADPELVNEMIQRIERIEIDSVFDATMLVQYIDDNPNSIFPQFLTTERPDVICSKLVEGKITCLVDNGSSAISAPTSFFEFFSSPDDYYQRWVLGTGTRILRFLAFIITVSFTATYVAVTTFHYEMVPSTLLLNLAESRNRVPFPPLFEALLMEVTIELLREAGARLPAKIGQTIGIVGGIVIGQAAVQAGLTSNILIIAVASSAIASFVIPSYIMSASIRILRFGLIALAGVWGMLGLVVGLGVIVIHLSGLKNLNTSYLTPIAPMNFNDWLDSFVRGPFAKLNRRPSQARSKNLHRNKMRK